MMEDQHAPANNEPLEASPSTMTPSSDLPQSNSDASAAPEPITEAPSEALPLLILDDPSLQKSRKRSTPSQPFAQQPWRTLTRRQVLMGMGIAVGVAAVGTGTTLAIIAGASSPDSSSSASPSSTGTPGATSLPPTQTPVSEEKLQAWRTKHLVAQPTQRFKYHAGTALVPLSVVEPRYPNLYNPYHIHLQGYVLGGAIVARTQFFLYLGLESLDGSQFVAKMRMGPVDVTSKAFGLLVVQQSTDDIEGGLAEFPQVALAPKTLYEALPALVDHCIEMDFIRQPLPAQEPGIPQGMLVEVNQQATISDQFLRADYEAIHSTPLAQLPTSELDPIRHLVDTSPITYHTPADAGRYPLVMQLILRQSDHLYPKLVAGR